MTYDTYTQRWECWREWCLKCGQLTPHHPGSKHIPGEVICGRCGVGHE